MTGVRPAAIGGSNMRTVEGARDCSGILLRPACGVDAAREQGSFVQQPPQQARAWRSCIQASMHQCFHGCLPSGAQARFHFWHPLCHVAHNCSADQLHLDAMPHVQGLYHGRNCKAITCTRFCSYCQPECSRRVPKLFLVVSTFHLSNSRLNSFLAAGSDISRGCLYTSRQHCVMASISKSIAQQDLPFSLRCKPGMAAQNFGTCSTFIWHSHCLLSSAFCSLPIWLNARLTWQAMSASTDRFESRSCRVRTCRYCFEAVLQVATSPTIFHCFPCYECLAR